MRGYGRDYRRDPRMRGYVGGRGMYDDIGGGLGRTRQRYRGPRA